MNKSMSQGAQDRFPAKQEEHLVATPQYAAGSPKEDDDEIDLRELLAVVRRRKGTIVLIALLATVAAFVATMMMTPIYRASTTLQIDTAQAKVLNYDVDANGGAAIKSRDYYQTQFEILKSRALARRTIDEMGLESTLKGDQVAKPYFSEITARLKSWVFGEESQTDPDLVDEDVTEASFTRASTAMENRLIGALTVSPVRNSQIVRLSYDSAQPELAANIVNAIADNYIALNLERRVDSASFAKQFLTEQLVDVKSRLEESEAKLIGYAKEKGLFKTGDEKSPSLIAMKVNDLSTALSKAERERIIAQSRYEQGQGSESASKVLEDSTVQALKKNLIELQGTYQEKLQIYKPGYPLMVQMKRQMSLYNDQISQETREIKKTVDDGLRAGYLEAKNNEAALREALEEQKQLLTDTRDKSIGYNTLLREVETSRSSYEGLLTRMKEVSVAGGIESNNISVLDPATTPFAKHTPSTRKNVAMGGVLGLFLGMVIAFLLEFFDDRVKSTEEVARILGLPLLGATPILKGTDPAIHALTTAQEPSSATAEAFRSLRTNLLFASRDGTPKVLALTSALPSEGKSSTCVNLATAFAQSNKRVLLIDADLRKPTAHKRLKLDNSIGLSNFLTGQAGTDAAIQKSMIEGVSVMTAGPLSPNPAELLSSERFQELFDLVPEAFDLIILDCPPVIGLADALILANRANATIMVSAFSQSRKRALQDSSRRLLQAHANLIGFVFTKVKSGSGYGYSYDYYYSYGAENLPSKTS